MQVSNFFFFSSSSSSSSSSLYFLFFIFIIPLFGSFTRSLTHLFSHVDSTQLNNTHTHTQVTTTTTTPGTRMRCSYATHVTPSVPAPAISLPLQISLSPHIMPLDVNITRSDSIIFLLLPKTTPFSHEDTPGVPKVEHYQCWQHWHCFQHVEVCLMLAQRSWIMLCEFRDSEERADLNSFFRVRSVQ